VFCWFVALSVLGVWNVFRSPGLDYRFVIGGALLPLTEALLSGPRLLHTMLGSVVLLGVVMAGTQRRRLQRRRLLGLPIGTFAHLVLDGVWARGRLFWWPFLGTSFGRGQVPELSHGTFGLVLEAVGIAALWWGWRAFGLGDEVRRSAFLRTGRLQTADGR